MRCRLLLVDDHPALTQGLAGLLGQEPDLRVCGQFATGGALLDFLAAAPQVPADVLLLDLHLPPPHEGLALLPALRQAWPALRVLVFSSAPSAGLVAQVAAAGAHGFVDKSVETSALLAAIRAVHAGQRVFPAPASPLLRQLSAREREIAGLVREGLSTRSIAARLSLSEYTVSTHRRNLMQKIGIHSIAGLVRFLHEQGL